MESLVQDDSTPVHEDSPTNNDISSNTTSWQVIKRNGRAVNFEAEKISLAISKAMLAVEGDSGGSSSRIKDIVRTITQDIVARFNRQLPQGGRIEIEAIQDQVELGLMRQGLQKVARAYVLYREQHAKLRAEESSELPDWTSAEEIFVKGIDGSRVKLDWQSIQDKVQVACSGFKDVDTDKVFNAAKKNIYSGIDYTDIETAIVMAVRPMIEQEPNYSFVAAQVLLQQLVKESRRFLDTSSDIYKEEGNNYSELLETTLLKGIELELLDKRLLEFDLDKLSSHIKEQRDRQFTYLGLQTLYDRYFLHWNDQRFELPQIFFMRVSMGLALSEDNPNERAIEFYNLLSSFDYMASTPTLFNSGTLRSQLSSCYLTTVDDDLSSIYQSMGDNAQLSKWAGGLGNDWTPVRALGSHIKGTNGKSQGVVPFLKVVNDTAVAVNQGGKRKGAVCAYLESWHLDIEDFLELRKNTGDERRRTHDMNTANWIPDLFMKRVFSDEQWTLFSPNDVPDLHDLYGRAFEEKYMSYEYLVEKGDITLFKRVNARDLWRKMLGMLFETGHPWITFKDPCNVRSPQQHLGVVHSSNLCTEITLNTNADEIAVCNLGSVNLLNHISDGKLNQEKLRRTIHTAVRMLDNVIDINFYPVDKAANSNKRHRPVGLGMMGFQDTLYKLEIPYASVDAVHFADQSMETISYFAIEASALLAKERGSYPSYKGSLWDKNIFPIDSLKDLEQQRGESYCTFDFVEQLNWQPIRDLVKQYGMRNSNVMAIAPTATISNIIGVSQSIEPTYQNLFVKSNLSGEFMVINSALVQQLKALGMWDSVMINDLKYFDGSLKEIERIPDNIKKLFETSFEIDSCWLIEAAARRQKWIDQAQSLNLYLAEASGKKLDTLYKLAWSRGLKTTYYLRSLGATQIEKNNEEKTTTVESAPVCSILDPECEACQ